MTESKEAWEHIAPELPPGWSVREIDYESWVVYMATGPDIRCEFDSESEVTESAWTWFGITRKRYAELIAVERVREAAAKLDYGHNVEVHFCSLGRVIVDVVSPIDAQHLFGRGQGPTLCDAAWAVIQSLGGGE